MTSEVEVPTISTAQDEKTPDKTTAVVDKTKEISPAETTTTTEKPETSPVTAAATSPKSEPSGFETWRPLFLDVLKRYSCYHIMPVSGKLVAFDSGLSVKQAFKALADNDVKCAPVWCPQKNQFIGFMSATDFADILYSYKKEEIESFTARVNKLGQDTVSNWCMYRKKQRSTQITRKFVYVRGDDPLFVAVHKMRLHFIHRMPVKHKNSILCILNHAQILKFIFQRLLQSHTAIYIRVDEMVDSIKTHTVYSLTADQSMSDAINLFSENKAMFAIAIKDSDSKVVQAFKRSDLRLFARNQAYKNLDLTISQFIQKYRPNLLIPRCLLQDNLLPVLWDMLCRRIHVCMVFDNMDSYNFVGFLNVPMVFDQMISDRELKLMYNRFKLQNAKNRQQMKQHAAGK